VSRRNPLPTPTLFELLPALDTPYSATRVPARLPQPVPELRTPWPNSPFGSGTGAPPPRRSTRKIWPVVFIGIVALLLLLLVLVKTSSPRNTSITTPSHPATTGTGHVRAPTPAPASAAPSFPGLHQVIRDGGLAFTVNDVQCGVTSIGMEPLVQTAPAGTQWCLVSITVSNESSGLQAFFSTYQNAIDDAGRKLQADTSAFFSMPNEGEAEDAQINPGASITVTVPFSLPTSDSIKRVELSQSGTGSGAVVSVP
jgi:Domain of unknown function (DUF4352)